MRVCVCCVCVSVCSVIHERQGGGPGSGETNTQGMHVTTLFSPRYNTKDDVGEERQHRSGALECFWVNWGYQLCFSNHCCEGP